MKRPSALRAAVPSPGTLSGSAAASHTGTPIVSACESTRESERLAEAALGRVGHARERAGVLRVGEERQVRHGVPDLRPLIELRPADDLVADLRAHQHVLEHPRLRVGPVEDRDLLARDALVDHPLDLRRHVARLRMLVGELPDLDRVALPDLRPQRLRPSARGCWRRRRWRPTGSSAWSGSSARA